MKRAVAFVALSFVLVLGMAVKIHGTPPGNDDRFDFGDLNKIRIGYKINPVPLNLKGKNVLLVGLGSYIVNGQADCAGCHSTPQYEPGGDPHLGQETKISKETFLSGGGDLFGPFRATQSHAEQPGTARQPDAGAIPGSVRARHGLRGRQPGQCSGAVARQRSASGHAVAGLPAHDAS